MTDDTQPAEYVSEADIPAGGGSLPMFDPKMSEPPAAEPKETYGSGEAERKRAHRKERGEKAEPSILIRDLPDDAPEAFRDVRGASKWRSKDYQNIRAIKRNLANPGEHPWVSGHIEGQKVREESEARERGDGADIRVVTYPNREPDETVNFREAVKDRAQDLRDNGAQRDAQAADERRRLLAELGAADLVAETQTEQPTEPVTEPAAEQQRQPEAKPEQQREQQQQEEYNRQLHRAMNEADQTVSILAAQETLVKAQLRQAEHLLLGSFPELQGRPENHPYLNPQRRQEFDAGVARIRQGYAELQQTASQRQLVQSQLDNERYKQQAKKDHEWQKEQWALTEKSIPEFADPVKRVELSQAVDAALAELGIVEEDLHPQTVRDLKSAKGRMLLADVGRLRIMRERAHEAVPRGLPQVQRPGVSSGARRDHSAEVRAALERQVGHRNPNTGAKAAAELLTMQRRARQERR